MFLKRTPQRNGRVKLSVCESYRVGKKTKQRQVRSLGYIDELEEEHQDPIEWGRAQALEMTREKKEGEQALPLEIHPLEKIDRRGTNRKNLGCAIALAVYSALGIEQVLRNYLRGRSVAYDLNSVTRLLVTERILGPGSKRAAWQNRERYFFKSDFTDDDLYRALDELARAKDKVVSSMNRRIAAAGMRDMSCVYYDVTNYYFESDAQDELRKRGVSKENRRSPIVQMGLLQDERGIPICYRKFSGNTPDAQTMIPVLSDLKRDYGMDRLIAVADKGLNSSDNIAAAVARGGRLRLLPVGTRHQVGRRPEEVAHGRPGLPPHGRRLQDQEQAGLQGLPHQGRGYEGRKAQGHKDSREVRRLLVKEVPGACPPRQGQGDREGTHAH